jgi:hypothetical protein
VLEHAIDALDRIGGISNRGFEDLLFEHLAEMIQDGEQQVFLGWKEVVEAATGGMCLLHDFVDTGLGVALPEKEICSGGDQPFTGLCFARQPQILRAMDKNN